MGKCPTEIIDISLNSTITKEEIEVDYWQKTPQVKLSDELKEQPE